MPKTGVQVGVGSEGRVLLKGALGLSPPGFAAQELVTLENHINFLKLWQNTIMLSLSF